MALRYVALLVAACLHLSQADVYNLPSTTAGYGHGGWNSLSSVPSVGNFGHFGAGLGGWGPFATPGSRSAAAASAYPGASDRPWTRPAPVPFGLERNWNTPALPSINSAVPWGAEYWNTPAIGPNVFGGHGATPQEDNWNGWAGHGNVHAWNAAAPEVATLSPQEANLYSWGSGTTTASDIIGNVQLPTTIELPAPRALPKAPKLPTVRTLPVGHQHLIAPHQLPSIHPLQGGGCHLPAEHYLLNPYQVPATHALQPSTVRQVPLNHPLSAPFDPAQAHPLQLGGCGRGPISWPSGLYYY